MSILQQLKRSRDGTSLNFYHALIQKGKRKEIKDDKVEDDVKTSRSFRIKTIDDNKRKLKDQLVKTQIERKRAMEEQKKPEPPKNLHKIKNDSLTSLVAGLHDAQSKNEYIKDNRENFVNLPIEEQRQLFRIYLDQLDIPK